jgi:site-specific DNA recombinase
LERQQARLLEGYQRAIIAQDAFERTRQEIQPHPQALAQQLRQLAAQAQQPLDCMGLTRHITALCRQLQPTLAHLDFPPRRQRVERRMDRVIVMDGQVELRSVIPTSSKGEPTAFGHLRLDYLSRFPPVATQEDLGEAPYDVTRAAPGPAGA